MHPGRRVRAGGLCVVVAANSFALPGGTARSFLYSRSPQPFAPPVRVDQRAKPAATEDDLKRMHIRGAALAGALLVAAPAAAQDAYTVRAPAPQGLDRAQAQASTLR